LTIEESPLSESISLQYLAPSNGASDAGALTIEVRDHALFGKEAKLEIVVVGKVNRSGGIDEQDVVFEHVLTLAPSQSVALPLHLLERYRFQGRGLSIELYAELSVKLGLLQSTKVRLDLGPEEVAQENVKAMTDPKDSVKLAVNFKFLPFDAKIKVAGLGLIGIFVALLGLLVGVHDQKVPEKEAYFFDHHTSKGKSESPLMKGLVGGGLFGVGIYIAIQYQLGRYMKLEIKSPETLGHDAKVPIAQLVRGKAYAPRAAQSGGLQCRAGCLPGLPQKKTSPRRLQKPGAGGLSFRAGAERHPGRHRHRSLPPRRGRLRESLPRAPAAAECERLDGHRDRLGGAVLARRLRRSPDRRRFECLRPHAFQCPEVVVGQWTTIIKS